ncbi:heme-binding protein [Kineosporia rhizophila]|uniref:GlcG/HbpS family heme-binding protein n=1 Tax=Kineosporia TaxID=49184 RepID=UPI001E4559D8|nr:MULTISPECIES: heme-binding protein [Kineosporia]MCE0534787.1 heme-binding protein [Kineosporia rhizophila]GLY19286.1 PduO protein [Kineosporia sp. NBRC 101677]
MSRLTLTDAQRMIDAGVKEAISIGQPMNIAVVDDGGHLVAFVRMDGAIKASIDISTRKARTSIMMEMPTADLAQATQPGAELYGLEHLSGGLVTFGGGIPVLREGQTVGAVGVSAGSVDQDVTVAQAAVAAF